MRLPIATGALLAAVMASSAVASAPELPWTLIASRPHDRRAFTEGLVAHGPVLLESTGLEGRSSVRRVDPATGRVLRITPNPARIFGEGLTVLKGSAWQLTWRNRVINVFAPTSLRRKVTRPYPFEGWGLATDGKSLIASDGSPTVRWLSPSRLTVQRTISVHDGGTPVARLNELEMIDGVLWSNVWLTNHIALIDPADGHVRAWIDLSSLNPGVSDPDAVPCGIAVDPITHLPVVTGKLWPHMYVIRLDAPIPA
ncbi:MAG: glutaminyl-peptide cyclotransferase [Miltoncostaeaceae bacterium]